MALLGIVIVLILGSVALFLTHQIQTKKRETTIRQLKQRARQEIQETCEAAKKGDPCAALKLQALEETLTERSLRLTGQPKPPSTVILPPDAIKQ